MGLLSTIMSKVFGGKAEAPASEVKCVIEVTPATPAEVPPAPEATAAVTVPPPEPFDVTAYLDGLAAKAGEKLDWKVSIVDLMKLVGMDSSLASRKELAKELQYSGDTADSAKMNVWLHKQVMQQIAANGGKLPGHLTA
jgi:hypothetical protein